MPLSRHSVRTYQETSSHATRQRTPGHSRLSSLSHCGLILAQLVELVCASYLHFKKKKKRGGGMNCRTFSQNGSTRGKSQHHMLPI